MAGRTSYDEDEGRPNLTPMIDCVFLLLVFFMVTAVFTQTQVLRIELPGARHADTIEKKQLKVAVGADGRFEVNGEVVPTIDALILRLQAEAERVGAAQGSAEVEVILRADAQTSYGEVMSVMKRLADVATKVSLATDVISRAKGGGT